MYLLFILTYLPASIREGILEGRIDSWVEAGLITEEQAQAIRDHEATRREYRPTSRRTYLAEMLGYSGGLLIAGGFLAWTEDSLSKLGTPTFTLVCAVLSIALGLAGHKTFRDLEGGSGERLGGFLWMLSVASTFGVTLFTYLSIEVSGPEAYEIFAGSIGATAVAAIYYKLRQTRILQLVLFLCIGLSLFSGVETVYLALGIENQPKIVPAVLFLHCATWLLLGARSLLKPAKTARELGALGIPLSLAYMGEPHFLGLGHDDAFLLAVAGSLVLSAAAVRLDWKGIPTRQFGLLIPGSLLLLVEAESTLQVAIFAGLALSMLAGAATNRLRPAGGLAALGATILLLLPVIQHEAIESMLNSDSEEIGLWVSLGIAILLLGAAVRTRRAALMVPPALAMLFEIPVLLIATFDDVLPVSLLVILAGVLIIAVGLGLLRVRGHVQGAPEHKQESA